MWFGGSISPSRRSLAWRAASAAFRFPMSVTMATTCGPMVPGGVALLRETYAHRTEPSFRRYRLSVE